MKLGLHAKNAFSVSGFLPRVHGKIIGFIGTDKLFGQIIFQLTQYPYLDNWLTPHILTKQRYSATSGVKSMFVAK